MKLCLPKQTTHNAQRTTHNAQPISDARVAEVIGILAGDLQYPWQLGELADLVLMSPRQLERCCKAMLGCGPLQYLRHLRLQTAARLLCTTHEHINQIGQQVGIPDARYFRRCFKEFYGLSPVDYRQQQMRHVVFDP